MKSEVSKKNPYWIPRHRYLELKNWCLQYPEWEEFIINARYMNSKLPKVEKTYTCINRVEMLATQMAEVTGKMEIVENTCNEVAHDFYMPFLIAITNNISYDELVIHNPVLPSRSEWYKAYRKFFYILSQKRE